MIIERDCDIVDCLIGFMPQRGAGYFGEAQNIQSPDPGLHPGLAGVRGKLISGAWNLL